MSLVEYHPEKIANCNGIDICYDSFGDPDDPAVLLIMGLATQLIHWNEGFCRELAEKGYYVVRFDNRDIGRSSKLHHSRVPGFLAMLGNFWFGSRFPTPYTLNDMAHDAFALLDNLSIETAHLVGVSMGGMIAQCMALMAPQRVLSLTSIMSTTGNRSLPRASRRVSVKLGRPMPREEEAFVRQSLEMWRMLHGNAFDFDRPRIEGIIRLARSRGFYPKGIMRQLSAIIAAEDRTAALGKLTIPTLVMHGDADVLVPVECGIATHQAIPDSRLRIFEGMGHTLPSELWTEIISEIHQNAT